MPISRNENLSKMNDAQILNILLTATPELGGERGWKSRFTFEAGKSYLFFPEDERELFKTFPDDLKWLYMKEGITNLLTPSEFDKKLNKIADKMSPKIKKVIEKKIAEAPSGRESDELIAWAFAIRNQEPGSSWALYVNPRTGDTTDFIYALLWRAAQLRKVGRGGAQAVYDVSFVRPCMTDEELEMYAEDDEHLNLLKRRRNFLKHRGYQTPAAAGKPPLAGGITPEEKERVIQMMKNSREVTERKIRTGRGDYDPNLDAFENKVARRRKLEANRGKGDEASDEEMTRIMRNMQMDEPEMTRPAAPQPRKKKHISSIFEPTKTAPRPKLMPRVKRSHERMMTGRGAVCPKCGMLIGN